MNLNVKLFLKKNCFVFIVFNWVIVVVIVLVFIDEKIINKMFNVCFV